MRLVLLLSLFLAACGGDHVPAATPVPTPHLPFGAEITGERIDLLEPFDTRTEQYTPSNVNAAVPVGSGNVTFSWTAVEGADGYALLILNAASASSFESGDLTAHYWQWVTEPAATVNLTGAEQTQFLQIYAYWGMNVIGQSELWVLEASLN